MDHSEAVATQAVEKYLLGELSDEEQSAFEEHYFDCPDCASDVETCSLFVRHARAVFRETPAAAAEIRAGGRGNGKERKSSIWSAMADFFRRPLVPATAAAALGMACMYQGAVVIPALKRSVANSMSAQPLVSFQLFQAVRGGEKTVAVPFGATFFALSFDVTWDGEGSHYRCSLTDSRGQDRFSIRVPAPEPGQPVSILVPARGFEGGIYRLAVTPAEPADGGTPLATYDFNLKIE
jgi:hypothetical protein